MTLESFLSGRTNFQRAQPKRVVKKPTRGKRKARVNYVADFEATTDPLDCRVWSWGLVPVDNATHETVEIGQDIDSFMERMSEHNATVYFHNLKFDAMFLIDWLLNHDYMHVNADQLTYNDTFKTLISHMGQFYSVTVRWSNGHSTEFRDSLKKIPMPVSRIAKAFKLDDSKGEIDYHAPRPIGHVLTEEEKDYLRRDVLIVAQAMKEILDTGMTKLTVASDSLAEYKKLTGSEHFTRLFPVLHESIDGEIRRAYRGGFTYADDRFRGRKVRSGVVLDVNSLYPSVMKFKMLPYGEPVFQDGYVEPSKDFPLVVFSVTFTAKLKPKHIPCIQIKGSMIFSSVEYLKEINEPTTLMVTNVDWALYNEHYDIDILAYGGGWKFRAVVGMFDNYIDKWSTVKERETGGKREIAKLHLNALYGKFATNPLITAKYPVLENGIVKLVRGKDETRSPVYTAVGVFITAYAREITIRAAQENYDVFAYADTDSLHLLIDEIPNTIDVHPTRLGAWKHEYNFDAAYYIRPKAYLERIGGEADCEDDTCNVRHDYVNHIAGLPESISSSLTFDDLVEGRVLVGKLTPKTVPGGVVLKDIPFELKLS